MNKGHILYFCHPFLFPKILYTQQVPSKYFLGMNEEISEWGEQKEKGLTANKIMWNML